MTIVDEITTLPLSDGTACILAEVAADTLAEEFGIRSARLKKGAGGNVQVVATPKSAQYRNAKEVALIDLIAIYAYIRGDLAPGQRWVCADGDPRNLTRENIVASVLAEPVREPEVPCTEKKPAIFLDNTDIEWQLDTLADALYNRTRWVDDKGKEHSAISILDVGKGKLGKALAQEVLGEVTLEIVGQIRRGKFRGKTRARFFGWIRTIAKRQFSKRLQGVLENVIGDIEPDQAEMRLMEVLRASGAEQEMLERTEFVYPE